MRRARVNASRRAPPARAWVFHALAVVIWGITLGAVAGMTAGLGSAGDAGAARGWGFAGALLGWLFVFVGFGVDVSNDPLGVLTSGRNRYSLSRLQMTLWTWVVLSALMAVAVSRAWGLGGGTLGSALAIDIDNSLLEAMGISFFSGAATPALMALKARSPTDRGEERLVSVRMREPTILDGQAIGRPPNAPARLADLVEGDDAGTAGSIDLSKVQQLMMTVVLVGTYTAMLFGLFTGTDAAFSGATAGNPAPGVTILPKFSEDFVKLLLLSHAGYLGYKAMPKAPPVGPAPRLAGGPPPTPDRKGGAA